MSISESLKQKIPDWLKLPWRIALRAYMHLCLQYSFLRYSRPVRKEFLFFRAHSDEIEAQMSLPFAAELLQAVVDTDYLEGNAIECGTYKGGSAILIAHVLNMIKAKKLFYACDTFEGHSYDDIDSAVNYHRAGRGSDTSVSYVGSKFQKFKVSDRIKIIKGKFEDTLLNKLGDKTFSLAFLDCDLYDSAKFCYSFLYPRMVRGGCIVVHDYAEPDKERGFGISLATDGALHEKGLVIKPSGPDAHVIWIP
jgi:predicted O-methyltransferase YrrM